MYDYVNIRSSKYMHFQIHTNTYKYIYIGMIHK